MPAILEVGGFVEHPARWCARPVVGITFAPHLAGPSPDSSVQAARLSVAVLTALVLSLTGFVSAATAAANFACKPSALNVIGSAEGAEGIPRSSHALAKRAGGSGAEELVATLGARTAQVRAIAARRRVIFTRSFAARSASLHHSSV